MVWHEYQYLFISSFILDINVSLKSPVPLIFVLLVDALIKNMYIISNMIFDVCRCIDSASDYFQNI